MEANIEDFLEAVKKLFQSEGASKSFCVIDLTTKETLKRDFLKWLHKLGDSNLHASAHRLKNQEWRHRRRPCSSKSRTRGMRRRLERRSRTSMVDCTPLAEHWPNREAAANLPWLHLQDHPQVQQSKSSLSKHTKSTNRMPCNASIVSWQLGHFAQHCKPVFY